MTPQSFVTLATVTVAVVALAVVTATTSQIGDAIAERGEALVPGMTNAANDIGSLTVDLGDTKTVVTREGDRFVDQTGYPIKQSLVAEIAANLALMRIEERKTADPDRLKDLRLADPGAEQGGGERLTVTSQSGSTIADLILGERDYTVGGTRGGQFIRRAGNPQSFLVRGSLSVPLSRSSWFDPRLTDVGRGDITAITAMAGAAKQWELTRGESDLAPQGLSNGAEADTDKVGSAARLVGPIRFTDVRKAGEAPPPADAVTIKVETKTGLTLTLASLKTAPAPASEEKPADPAEAKPADAKDTTASDEETRWVRISVASSQEESADQAKELAGKVDGFEFRLSTSDYEKFTWTSADFEAKPES